MKMAQINVLSKEISELIAAGEVIDRPASIIKELLENSIDAGANVITVEIKNGGRTYIRVTDNGSGISKDDISKAFFRHATSKINSKLDLDNILTLGFRGEALASISAVAKVEVLTKLIDEDYGSHYVIEGGEEKILETTGCPDGTTFVVRDIFYNVPARLKFLKSDLSEANQVANYVTKLALSHPEISFKYIKDNKTELLTAGDGKLFSSIYSVFGKEFASSLIPVDYTWSNVHVWGYTSKPLMSKSNRKFQNFFVNGRYVRSKTCCVATEEAYRNSIMTGKFPSCVLCIDVSPKIVDVNVHPTKIEVRFSDDKLIHEAIYFAIKEALLLNDKPVEMNLNKTRYFTDKQLFDVQDKTSDEQLNFSNVGKTDKVANMENENIVYKKNENKFTSSAKSDLNQNEKRVQDLFLSSLDNSQVDDDKELVDFLNNSSFEQKDILEDNISEPLIANNYKQTDEVSDFKYITNQSFEKKEEIEEIHEAVEKPIVIGELFKTYIVAQVADEMLLVDKHAAHERYIFEKIKSGADELDIQMYLEPFIVLLSYSEFDALIANLEQIQKLGFDIEPDLAPNVAVKGVPIILGDENPTEIVVDLAKNFLEHRHNPQLELFDELYHSIACKAAIKANDNSSIIELQALVNNIYERDDIRYCPHGRPVMIRLNKRDIEKQFKRIL